MKGITIDAEAIARGMYEMFSDNEKACMAFGLVPQVWVDRLRKSLEEKAAEIAEESTQKHFGATVADAEKSGLSCDKFKADFVEETLDRVVRQFYSVAKMVV